MPIPGYLGRVLGSAEGPAVGTCFQVDDGVLVTAAHVLAGLGADLEGGHVSVEALAAGGPVATATVARLDLLHDLAVMTTAHTLPGNVVAPVESDAHAAT